MRSNKPKGWSISASNTEADSAAFYIMRLGCMIKIFMGEWVVDEEGSSSEGCLKWGVVGH